MDDEDAPFGDTIPGKTEEGIALLGAPFRGEIAGGHNDEESGRALNLAHDFRGERPIATEVLVDQIRRSFVPRRCRKSVSK